MAKHRIGYLICFAVTFLGDFCSDRFLSEWSLTLSASRAQEAQANYSISERTSSVLGKYLAGRHAERAKNYGLAARMFSKIDEKKPKTLKIQQRLLFSLAAAGEINQAVVIARSMTKGGKVSSITSLILFADAIRSNDLSEAAKVLNGTTVSAITNFTIPLLKAWTMVATGDYKRAISALDPLTKIQGFKPMRLHHIALIEDFRDNEVVADQAYIRALDEAKSIRTLQAYGRLLERSGRRAEAYNLYTKYRTEQGLENQVKEEIIKFNSSLKRSGMITTSSEGIAEVMFNLAGTLTQSRSFDLALVFCRLAIWIKPKFPMAKMLLGNLLEIIDRPKEALNVFQSVDEVSTSAWESKLRQAELLNSLGRKGDAEKTLRRMANQRSEDMGALTRLGDIFRGTKEFAKAADVYTEAIKRTVLVEKPSWSLLYSRGIAYERSKKWSLAEKDFLDALELSPNQPYLLNYLGYSWVDRGLYLDRAKGMIEKAVRLRPNDGYIVDSLGWVLYRLGDFESATVYLERAISLYPQDPTINDHLGDAYWRVGRMREAEFQWQRALSFGPEPEQVSNIRKKLLQGLPEAQVKQ